MDQRTTETYTTVYREIALGFSFLMEYEKSGVEEDYKNQEKARRLATKYEKDIEPELATEILSTRCPYVWSVIFSVDSCTHMTF